MMKAEPGRARAAEVRSTTWPVMIMNRAGSGMKPHWDERMETKWTQGRTGDDCRAGGSEGVREGGRWGQDGGTKEEYEGHR